MKRWTFLGTVALMTPLLVGCGGSGVDWSDPDNPLCVSGHYEADYDNKKVKVGTETYQKYNSTKKRYETKTRAKYETKRVYDGQDWVCDLRSENAPQ